MTLLGLRSPRWPHGLPHRMAGSWHLSSKNAEDSSVSKELVLKDLLPGTRKEEIDPSR